MTGDKLKAGAAALGKRMAKVEYNEDDLPGMRVEPYDAKHVKRLESENADAQRRLVTQQIMIDNLEKSCVEYSNWLAEKDTKIEQLEDRCKEADKRAKPYGMNEWKGGEEARASYVERITALEKENVMLIENYNAACAQNELLEQANEYVEKLCAEQDRKIREDELRHQAELEKLRAALGMFLFHPTAFNEAVENARRVLAVKDEQKPVAQTADEFLAKNPGVEKKFWEDALQVQLDSVGESQWTKNIREALRTGKFPPKPV